MYFSNIKVPIQSEMIEIYAEILYLETPKESVLKKISLLYEYIVKMNNVLLVAVFWIDCCCTLYFGWNDSSLLINCTAPDGY